MSKKCFRCKQPVYAAEAKLALRSSFHVECFTCAVCNKSLDSTTVCECFQGPEIYCTVCYKKHYGLPGYGYSPTQPTLLTNDPPYHPPSDECCCTNCDCDLSSSHPMPNGPRIDQTFVSPPSRQGGKFTKRLPPAIHYSRQVRITKLPPCTDEGSMATMRSNNNQPSQRLTCGCENIGTNRSTTRLPPPKRYADGDASASSGNESWTGTTSAKTGCGCRPFAGNKVLSKVKPLQSTRGSVKTNNKKGGDNMPYCLKCGEEVFWAERVLGYSGVYHVRCFVCDVCGKTLDATTVNEHDGRLFCKGCYKREHGTAGVGYGIGAGALQTP